MEMGVSQIVEWCHHGLKHQSDPRTSSWFLMSSPWPMLSIVIGYLVFVKVAPQYMAKRKPFEFKKLLVGYNFVLVLLSLYMLYEIVATSFLNSKFNKTCQRVDYSNDPNALRLAGAIWWYFFSKIIELLDTVFFILRKKNNQVTFLHVYHHSTMVILWWLGTKFVAGGESYFCSSLNSFIHVLMYTYYMLSACGPAMQKYLWWKRYMTKLQLLQFFLVVCHASVAAYSDCGFPRTYLYMLIAYMISHIVLFSNFYYHSYVVKKQHDNNNGYHGNQINEYSNGSSNGHYKNGVVSNGVNGINGDHKKIQ